MSPIKHVSRQGSGLNRHEVADMLASPERLGRSATGSCLLPAWIR
ncbi:hypothetical protein P5Y53_00265 [Dyella jiangningensis]|nr:hypothetical protein [Dyella jiangningensis]